MIVYHSSNCIVQHPDCLHSRDNLDFGRGFYVTSLREQAEKYARRFTLRSQKAFLNSYDLSDIWQTDYSVKHFPAYDREWLQFVFDCRSGNSSALYDAIEGGIANDKVFRTIDLFFAGEISMEEALKRLVYEKPNHQICFCSEAIMNNCLSFISAEVIQ